MAAHLYWDQGFSSRRPARRIAPLSFPWLPWVSTMTTKSQRPKGRDGALSSLDGAIQAVDLAKEDSRTTQAKVAFGSVGALLAIIKVGLLLDSTQRAMKSDRHLEVGSHKDSQGLRRTSCSLLYGRCCDFPLLDRTRDERTRSRS